jgi:hypothetical protein
MANDQNEQPKFPAKPGRFDPVPFDFGTGERGVPHPKRRPRPGKASDTVIGFEDWDPFKET